MKNFTITLLCLCGIAIHVNAQIINETFDADGSEAGWEGLSDAASGMESSIDWNSNGNPTGALQVSATNTETAGKAYIFQEEYTGLDYGGASDVILSFDLKLDGMLVGTAVQLQVEIPGTGVVNDSNLELDGLNGATWTNYTFDYSGVMSGATTFRIHFNLANGDVGQGGILLVDNITLSGVQSIVDFENSLSGITAGHFETGGMIATNPDMAGINPSDNVYEITYADTNPFWGGVGFVFNAITLDDQATVYKAKLYSTVAASNIQFEVEQFDGGSTGTVGEVQQVVNANEWVELTFTLPSAAPAGVNRILIRPDVGSGGGTKPNTGTLYVDDVVCVNCTLGTVETESTIIEFENSLSGVTAGHFETGGMIASNPDMAGINPSDNVYEITYADTNPSWGGVGFVFNDITLDDQATVYKAKLYSTVAASNVQFEVEQFDGGSTGTVGEVQQVVNANEWVELTFTLPSAAPAGVNRILIRPDVGSGGGTKPNTGTLYVDDIVCVNCTLGGPEPEPSLVCDEIIRNNGDLAASEISVSIFSVDPGVNAARMRVEIESTDANAVDNLAFNDVGNWSTVPGLDFTPLEVSPGVWAAEFFYGVDPPASVDLKIEWSKEGEPGNWASDFIIVDTDAECKDLSEFIVGSWGLKPAAGAFRIGNAGAGSGNFFTSGVGDVTIRDCLFNDLFVFNEDGSFEVNLQGDWWGDTEVGVSPAQCIDETALAGVYADFQSSDAYTYSVSGNEMITVNGTGAFVGLGKAYNGGEYNGADGALQTSVTYEVLSFDTAPGSKELVISINVGDINYWTFELIPQEVPPSLGDYTLVWSDEFDSESEAVVMNSDNWFHQTQFPQAGGWFNGEEQHYTNRIDNSFMQNNAMQIVAKSETFDDGQGSKDYTSARLNSKFSFTYGRVDVRAIMPTGKGTWPAIWTLGTNVNETGGFWNDGVDQVDWPISGEIDIMEHWGDDQDVIHGSTHTPASSGSTENTGTVTAFDVSDIFHIYSIIWDENEIQFLVDNEEYYTYNPVERYGSKITDPEDPNMNWPFDLPQYLLLNVAMGGIFQGPLPHEIDPAFEESAMVIDYVRVYQTDPVTQTIDFAEIGDRAFGDLPFAPVATASSGLPVEFSVKSGPIGFSNGLIRINGVGEAVITARQAGNEEFPPVEVDQTFTINKASQVITFGEISDKTLDDSGFAIEVESSSGLPVSLEVTASPDLLLVDIVDNESVSLIPLSDGVGGTVSITASQAGNDNYLAAENVVESFDIVAFLVSGIEDRLKVELSLYPNPAQESIRLSVPEDDSGANISVNILDLSGQSLMDLVFDRNAPAPEIDISVLPAGTYVLQVTMGDTYGYGKFIKAN